MTTEERLHALEREQVKAKRRDRWLSIGVVCTIGLLGLTWVLWHPKLAGQGQGADVVPKEIRANAFLVENAKGQVCARLYGRDDYGAMMELYDNSLLVMLDTIQERSVFLDVTTLSFMDGYQERVQLSAEEGRTGLRMYSKRGRESVRLVAAEFGSALFLADERDTVRAGMAVLKGVGAGIELCDQEGNTIWEAPPVPPLLLFPWAPGQD